MAVHSQCCISARTFCSKVPWLGWRAGCVSQQYLQDDVVEADEVLWPWRAFAILVRALLLQQSLLQGLGHALVAFDGRGQLDVGQITARKKERNPISAVRATQTLLCVLNWWQKNIWKVNARVWSKMFTKLPESDPYL